MLLSNKDSNIMSTLLRANEKDLIDFCYKFLRSKYNSDRVIRFEDEFVYAAGDIPVLLIAHLDTVLSKPPTKIYATEDRMIWTSPDTGLGADDRAGVYAIIKIILSGRKPSILFTTGEEVGGLGAMTFVKMFPRPVSTTKYLVEIDRRGRGQSVYYDCGNKKFEEYINSVGGFTTHQGIFSDISFICPNWNVAGVNISAGYYNEHTKEETLNFNDLFYSIDGINKLLDDADNAQFFAFEAIPDTPYPINVICDCCGYTVPYFSLTKVQEKKLCPNCVEKHVAWCLECGEPHFFLKEKPKKCEVCGGYELE